MQLHQDQSKASKLAESIRETEPLDNDGGIDPENEISGLRLLLVHTSLCLCTFLVGLDFNLIATAVPVITSEFNSIGDVGWYGSAFYIALCASQPLTGKTFTLFSKKWMYLAYVLIFEAGSLICALAPSSPVLILGRAIAGFGASGIFAGGLVIVTTVIPLHKRAIWTGTMNSTFVVASVIGPVIGGALTQHVTWRWCFYINLPIGAFSIAVFLLFFHIKPSPTEDGARLHHKLKSLDGLGFVLFAGAVAMLLLPLQLGGTSARYAWDSSRVIGMLVGCGATLTAFVAWQVHLQDSALIPPRLFRNRNTPLIFASAAFANGPFQCIIYWLPVWFQAVLDVSPIASGVRYLPAVISDVLTSIIGSVLVTYCGWWNPFLVFGMAMVSLGGGLLSTLHPAISDGHWIGYQIFAGVGYSLVVNMAHIGVQASLPPSLVPLGATTLLFSISASCAIFLAVGQAIFQEQLASNLAHVVPQDVLERISAVGATNVRSVIGADQQLAVLDAYSQSITRVFYLPAGAAVLAFLLASGTKWISIKKTKSAETYGA
ncbi:major facilitator superfamily domain-containing protein [Aspergillus recurvatus]